MNQRCMVVGFEKSQGQVARLDWSDRQTKMDVPTDIFIQGCENPLSRVFENPLTYLARGAKSQHQTSNSDD